MDPEILFRIVSTAVMPMWILLVVVPRWKGTLWLIRASIFPALLAVSYFILLLFASGDLQLDSFSSLAGLQVLFSNPYALLVGWVHFLCFDLFVGSWEVQDAQKQGIPHLLVIPCLFFTLMLGPFGFLLYLLLRLVWTSSITGKNEPT